jgi:hypothetical protein
MLGSGLRSYVVLMVRYSLPRGMTAHDDHMCAVAGGGPRAS